MHKIIKQVSEKTNIPEHLAWSLLSFITNKDRAYLQFFDVTLTSQEEQQLAMYIEQMTVHHKPLAYIIGWVPFLDLHLKIKAPTLIPRPETEYWVNKVISWMKNKKAFDITILDIGTGSGCIALSLAHAFPQATVYGVDIAQTAIMLAQENAKNNTIENAYFLQSDLFEQIPADVKFDLIISNPPYINPAVQLERSVQDWEDHGALFAHHDGLYIIKKIIQNAAHYLKKNETLDYQLIIEIDEDQGDALQTLVANNKDFMDIVVQQDQFHRDRTIWIK